ncbi:DBH-like monooxygenase protein 1 [Macrobrachium nipponense]|uniref:DBH-like monooxygenase protein 1 n=1 Tax=Macrobrachium nipponense TaxID=159736 RepID=UPI0030C89830
MLTVMENVVSPSSVANPYYCLLADAAAAGCFSCNHRHRRRHRLHHHHHSHTNFRAAEERRRSRGGGGGGDGGGGGAAMQSPPPPTQSAPPLPRDVPATGGDGGPGTGAGAGAVYIPLTSKVRLWLSNSSSSSSLWNLPTTVTSFKAPVSILLLRLLQTVVLLSLLPNSSAFASSSFITQRLTSYEQWTHEAWLEETGAFVVQWTPKEEHIEFRVTARTTGYIGFGLSSSPRMDGADIVVGWVHSGKAYLQDRHGKGNEEPSVDEQRDWMLVGGYENDTHTVLIMSRPYNTCDKQDHIISNDTVRLLWAYHPDDPVDPESPRPRLHYHGGSRRGARSMFLLERGHKLPPGNQYPQGGAAPHEPSSSSPSSSASFSHHAGHRHHPQRTHHHRPPTPTKPWLLINNGVEVGEKNDTVYWCKIFKRPPLREKNHVISYEPVFNPEGNERYLHHMIVYECTDLSPELEVAFEELSERPGHECYLQNMTQLIYTCNHVVVAWAVGSEGLTLPSEAGYPLTPNGPKYYMMEAHYDNPEEHNFTDYSGIRIIYTPELRFYDAGVLSIGLDPNWKHQIPPRQRTVLSEGHCVGECTEAALPPTGINVFAVILHTHLLGRKVRVRHIRDGRELEPIAQDNNYDFNYQEYRALSSPRTVLPGDHLIGECTYNSRERTTITLGGFKTRDEMCLSYLFYWPKVDLSFCHSKPSLNTVLHALGIQELWPNSNPIKIRQPIELAGRTLEWRLLNYDWKNHFEYFQDATHTGTFNPMCWRRGESLIPDVEKLDYEYPNITEPWVAENVCRKRRRKNRRRKNKTARGRNHHLVGHGAEGEELEEEDGDTEEEVMFDDQMNSKPIETIDVDHYNHRDIFMPVMEEHLETGIIDIYGVDTGHSAAPDRELQKEFQDMERDLEEEMHKKFPDTFQERTGHPNKNELGSSAPANTVSLLAVVSVLALSFLTILYDGHG